MTIEACIHCDTLPRMIQSVRAAYDGGASRLELCAEMAVDGLTPAREFIVAARENFQHPGVLVMIRPRAGNFIYGDDELLLMQEQISMAAECGADGVVFGLLDEHGHIDQMALARLMKQCQKLKIQTTFHRAFDAASDKVEALENLINSGIDRILTSGMRWGEHGSALGGLPALNELIDRAADRIEIVIGGGVSPTSAREIVRHLSPAYLRISLHAYSGIRKNGITDAELVNELKKVAERTKSMGGLSSSH